MTGIPVLDILLLTMYLMHGHSSASLLSSGDKAFFSIDYPSAVAAYESALTASRSDPEALWRLARVYVCMAETAGADDRRNLLSSAETFARLCIQVDPDKSEGHTWLAGALGYRALDGEPGEQVRLSHELLREVHRAISLNPSDDAAYSIMGSFYRALGNVGWLRKQIAGLLFGSLPEGGFEEAEASLKEAIAHAPDIMRHHYELGVLYLDQGRNEEAIQVLTHASTLPIRVAIDRARLKKINELLVSMGVSP